MHHVRWIKSLDGFGGESIVAAGDTKKPQMHEMASDIGGKNKEWLAIYVNQENKDEPYPSMVQGFVQIKKLRKNENLYDNCPMYEWNRIEKIGDEPEKRKSLIGCCVKGEWKWPIACRAKQPWKKIPDHLIIQTNNTLKTLPYTSGKEWKDFRGILRGSPSRIDCGDISPAGAYLTEFINKHFDELECEYDRCLLARWSLRILQWFCRLLLRLRCTLSKSSP